MKQEIKVPPMGESISEAAVAQIMKNSGSQVSVDEEVLELETDKVNQVLHAPIAGILTLTVKVDDVVKIGDVLGYVDSEQSSSAPPVAQQAPAPLAAAAPPVQAAAAAPVQAAVHAPAAPAAEGSQVRISKEQFVAEVVSGPKPVQKTDRSKPSAPEIRLVEGARPERRVKMSKIRKVIARRLVESQQTTAMLTTFNEVDMSVVMEIRDHHKELFIKQHGVKLGFMSFFVKACVSALEAVPDINAYLDGEELVYREYYDIGVAVGTDRGLVVPVVRGCDKLSFAGVEKAIALHAKKAREGGLSVDDLQGGGFTITNGGVYGSLLSTPILNPPQSGILGMHNIQKRPVVVDNQIVIRPMMYLALSYDHRVVDGKGAVTFLIHVKEALEDPSRMLLGLRAL